jgi:hypothetical protein
MIKLYVLDLGRRDISDFGGGGFDHQNTLFAFTA